MFAIPPTAENKGGFVPGTNPARPPHRTDGLMPKVLVVDDEPEIIDEIRELLEGEGFACEGSTNTEQALSLIQNDTDISIVLTDIRMPGMDGMEMARTLKTDRFRGRDIALIIMTGHAGMAEAIEALQLGAGDFLTKPISPEYLLHAVKRALELSLLRERDRNYVRDLSSEVKRRTAQANDLAQELSKVNAELVKTNIELEQADKLKGEFLGMISHEMNTPLNAIIGFAQILESSLAGSGDQRNRENAGYIASAGERLMKSIQSILIMADIHAGNITANKQPILVRDLLQSITSGHQKDADTGTIAIRVTLKDDDILVVADPDLLQTALGNILENAVKFSGKNCTVRLGVTDDGTAIVFSIADDGPGMSEDMVAAALMPFKQADGSLGRRFEGLGIGLPIARKIAQLHGGTLTIESTPGQGTTVLITLPKRNVA